MQKRLILTLVLLLSLVLVACGGDVEVDATEPANVVGDAQNGETLYNMSTIGDSGATGCVTCHSVQPTDDPLQPSPVGPSHYGLADRAGTYVADMSAEEYLRESIVEPNAHLVEGYAEGLMYQFYEEELTADQIDDLVAYLLTLEGQ